MSHDDSDAATIRLPRWGYIALSVAILFHLGSVGARVLAAMSGPWPMGQEGVGEVFPPQFAASAVESLPGKYLSAIQLSRDYHFVSNRPSQAAYKMEVKLKDDKGEVIKTLVFPDSDANFWVRQRQQCIVGFLAADTMTRTPQSEVVPPPGQKAPELTYWKPVANSMTQSQLAKESVNDLPRGGMVFTPSDMEMLFVRSYVRYLRRSHGAASVEVIRIAHDPIPPAVLFDSNIPASDFDVRTFSYGDMAK